MTAERHPTPSERDNRTVWDGRREGWYEVYYLKLNHRASGTAAWIRYTLLVPLPHRGVPVAELWAIAFDARDPSRNLALKRSRPLDPTAIRRDPFAFAVGDARLEHSSARGALEGPAGRLQWDLAWNPPYETFRPFPYDAMYRWPLPKTKWLVPNQDVAFRGVLTWNDRVLECTGEPGQQSHLWGTQHADRWVWGHANLWADGADASFECLTSRLRFGPVPTPDLTLLLLRLDGRWRRLNALWRAPLHRVRIDPPNYLFEAAGDGLRLRGIASARLADLVGVEYTDPDGSHLWCYNTKVADLSLEVRDERGRQRTLRADRTFALEFVQRERDPRIPVRI
ncbi:MAG: hypothetical protein GYA57_17965 [Myxococcales bacterium]|nr:hypothetical protein [Myxococcales bacterium]